jgi:hypothetical protein
MMSKALVLGAAALVFSAANALADGSAELAPPAEGYAAPVPPTVYAAPPVYAAPVYTAPPIYVVPAPVCPAPVIPHHVYAYAPGYWGGYGHGWHGYAHRWWH